MNASYVCIRISLNILKNTIGFNNHVVLVKLNIFLTPFFNQNGMKKIERSVEVVQYDMAHSMISNPSEGQNPYFFVFINLVFPQCTTLLGLEIMCSDNIKYSQNPQKCEVFNIVTCEAPFSCYTDLGKSIISDSVYVN